MQSVEIAETGLAGVRYAPPSLKPLAVELLIRDADAAFVDRDARALLFHRGTSWFAVRLTRHDPPVTPSAARRLLIGETREPRPLAGRIARAAPNPTRTGDPT